MVVGGAGTGGTISGIGRKIKEVLPNCKVSTFTFAKVGSIVSHQLFSVDYLCRCCWLNFSRATRAKQGRREGLPGWCMHANFHMYLTTYIHMCIN